MLVRESTETQGNPRQNGCKNDSVIANGISQIILRNYQPKCLPSECRVEIKNSKTLIVTHKDTLLFDMDLRNYRLGQVRGRIDTMNEQDAIEYGSIVFRRCRIWDSIPQLYATPTRDVWLVGDRKFDFKTKGGSPLVFIDKHNYKLIDIGGGK